MISISCFVVFVGFLKKIGPEDGILARVFCPRVGVQHFHLARAVGIRPFKKVPGGFHGGDGQT